jgi:exodeoxyribonuclease V gamma subunit
VTFSRISPKQTVAAWLDLMALVAAHPGTSWRSVVVRRASKGNDPDVLELVGSGASPDERHRRALDALGVAVDIYRRGLCEPIPLFAKLSHRLHLGNAKPKDWSSDSGRAEGDDDANQLAFGHLDFRELCAVPANHDDPPGSAPGRADRFACYLWESIEASSEQLP